MPAQFVVKKGSTGKFRFNLIATNGQVIATSEAYETRAKALAGIESVRKNAPGAAVVDQTAPAAKPAAKATKAAAPTAAAAAKGAKAAPAKTAVSGLGGTAKGANKSPAKAAAMPSPTPADAKGGKAAAKKTAARKPAKKAGA